MYGALTIAGSDPTGGAGLQGDLQVFRACGVAGAAVVTALTIQDTRKVHRVMPVFPSAVLDQLRVVIADTPPAAIKIGMLATDDVARSVRLGLEGLRPDTPIVVDPVLSASDGSPLFERRGIPVLLDLIGRATLVTPNLVEAEMLTGEDVSSRGGCERAARQLVAEVGADAVLLKGGHREGSPDDLLAERSDSGVSFHWLAGKWIEGGPVHGTGCALSAAVAAGLASGRDRRTAIDAARALIADGIRGARRVGAGARRIALPGDPA